MTQKRSRKPIMSDMNRLNNLNENDDNDQNHWYHLHSSSPPSSLSVNNSFTHQSPSATMGSWGFDVNRSTNGQTPLSFTVNNNNNSEHHTIMKTTKDYNERLVDIPSSPQNFKLHTPTLTRHRNGNEFAAVDRLVFGPNRIAQENIYPSDERFQQQMISNNQSRIHSTNQKKTQTEQELLEWQNRMLERDQRHGNLSPNPNIKQNGFNSSRSSSRQIPTSIRPVSAMSNMSEDQHVEHDHHESTIKLARVIKRYIELLYHLQSFYERIIDQLFNGNNISRINQSSHSIFINHCRKITEQLQNCKPIWEKKLADLQNLLKDISSFEWSQIKNETTFLQRRSTLQSLTQTLNTQKNLDNTHISIRNDIDRVLHEDKLAVQLQDELSTLLQHQSLLNDFTALLQWNLQIYCSNEQNRVENVLPLLREQIITTDNYISHVSQQLNDLVRNIRSLEKYILSYTNTIPLLDDGMIFSQRMTSNRSRSRPYDEINEDTIRMKEQHHRNGNTNDDSMKTRSISMSRFIDSEGLNQNFSRDDLRISTKKNNIHLNTNNNNNNNGISTRFATVKSAKHDNKTHPNSILKPFSHTRSSNGRKHDYNIDNKILTNNEHIRKIKKNEDARKIVSNQDMRNIHNQNFNDSNIRSPSNHKRFDREHEKTFNLQSILAEEAKEKSRQVAEKRHLTRLHQQRLAYPNI